MAKWLFVVLMGLSSVLWAEQAYLNEHEEGWYWHKDPKAELKKKIAKTPTPNESQQPADPDKTWKLIGQKVEQARAKAILNPTPENIAQARRLQRIVVAQSNLFSEKWMLDLLLNPDQDESLVNPNNGGARDLYNYQNRTRKEEVISQISRTSGLVYFYEAGEPYSERMAEVLLDFAAHYQMPIMPVAMSKSFSPLFPNSRMDSGEANRMGVKHIPAVFALNPESKKTMPIAYGLVSQSELKDNILMAFTAFSSGESYAH